MSRVAIVSVYDGQQVRSFEGEFRTFIVTCGSTHTAHRIAIDRHSFNVQLSTTDALVRFARTTNAKGQCVTFELVRIKSTDGVSRSYGTRFIKSTTVSTL